METLFDNDFFNVLVFSKSAQFLDDCASDGLIQATMRNKKASCDDHNSGQYINCS